ASGFDTKKVVGGLLGQERGLQMGQTKKFKGMNAGPPSDDEIAELLFAWRIVKHVKSNAIVFTKDRQVYGVGAGQMNRVRSVRLAVEQAGDQARGAGLASDALFPFPP